MAFKQPRRSNLTLDLKSVTQRTRERPKGPFPLTAATVIRLQELSLIAAVTATFGRKRIAAERDNCGRKRAFRPQKTGSFYWNAHRKSRLRPKEHISAERGLDRNSYGRTLQRTHVTEVSGYIC